MSASFRKLSAGWVLAMRVITAGPDGNLWFVNPQNLAVKEAWENLDWRSDQLQYPTQRLSPISITAGPDGNVWAIRVGACRENHDVGS